LPNAWQVVFVRSPQAHARLHRLDTTVAEGMPGVQAVLTAQTLGTHHLPDINPLLPLLQACPFPLLADDTVHYAGQPVAMVIADTLAQARAAAAQIELLLDPLPVATDLHPDNPVVVRTQHQAGDMPSGEPQAQCQLQVPRLSPMPLEPRACSAQWNADQQTLTVWLGTQTPSRAQADVAKVVGLPLAQVHLISPDVGGAFGARASVSPEDLLVPLATYHLAHHPRTPARAQVSLRWTSTRSEDFAAGMHGRGSRLQGQLWVAPDGRLQALSARLHFSLGAWLPFSAVVPLRNAARILPGPYDVRTIDVQGEGSRAHAAPINIYRGAGRPEATLLMETLIERAARRLKLDPIALRRRNLIASEAMPYTTASGEVLDSGDYAALLDRACERFDYAAERAARAQRRQAGEWVGIGTALYVEPCGQGWESARVTWHADGRVVVASGSPAQGQGHATTYAALAAEQLGCDAAQVEVVMGDSAQCPPGIGALASRSTAIAGSAIVQACQAVKALRAQGAPAPWVAEETFTSQEAWSSGCVMVRLAIDAETGQPTLERMVWIDDAGHVLQPALVHGQLIGGAAQGIGQALLEQLVYDDQGQLLTGSLMDYAAPRADHMPEIDIASMHTPSPLNPLGVKGVGEAGCIGVPAAILNAAADALSPLGDIDLQFPLTSEQLWRALSTSSSPERSVA